MISLKGGPPALAREARTSPRVTLGKIIRRKVGLKSHTRPVGSRIWYVVCGDAEGTQSDIRPNLMLIVQTMTFVLETESLFLEPLVLAWG
jgi:hypothetical protein